VKVHFKINFWDIKCIVKVEVTLKDIIRKAIEKKYSINNFSKKLSISSMSLYQFLNNKRSMIRTKHLYEICSTLKLDPQKLQKYIIGYKDTNGRNIIYKIHFPYRFTPKDMRVVACVVGDGTMSRNGISARWIQKDILPLAHLLKNKLGYNPESYTDINYINQISIPSFFIKSFSHIIKEKDLSKKKILERSLKLPEKFKLALLIAIIEDEGNVFYRSHHPISIRMSNLEYLNYIKKLCDSLNYKTSEITMYSNFATFGNNKMYSLHILSDGIKKLGYDILEFENKYGKRYGLWKKRENFFKRWRLCTNQWAEKIRSGRNLTKELVIVMKSERRFTISELRKITGINRRILDSRLKILKNKRYINRIGRGEYSWVHR